MKVLLTLSLLATTSAFAQSLDVNGFKSLLTQRQALLERVNPGMSKKLITVSKIPTELGPCEVSETSVQTVLKIEGQKIIVHSKESYVPAQTPACAGFESQEVAVLFYDAKPSLAEDLADLDASASQIRTIVKAGDLITMTLQAPVEREDGTTVTENVTVKYDLTKPTFKNLIFTQDSTQTVNGQDMLDVDVNTIDLRKVLFCESAESDRCSEGDFSDILF